MPSIYIAKNLKNEKLYIGQTSMILKDRMKMHKYGKGILGKAIRKHGFENFEVIEIPNIPEERIDFMEIEMIRIMGSLVPNGYNLSLGGKHNYAGMGDIAKKKMSAAHIGIKYGPMSEEQKRKMSIARKGKPSKLKGRKMPKEFGEMISRIKKAQHLVGWNRGIPMTDAAKAKASATLKGRIAPNKKKVICIETGEIFDTIRLAAKNKNTSENNLCSCLKGRLRTSGGFHWKYFEEGKK
jgi:group I intron endonuclease